MQLHQPPVLQTLEQLEARIIVISFAPLDRLRTWVPAVLSRLLERSYVEQQQVLPNDVLGHTSFLADPSRAVYSAYGLGRNSRLQVYGPSIIWQYFRWGLQGKRLPRTNEDVLQRGGDFVVGRNGGLTLAYVGRDQADRPPFRRILAALNE